jgi:hypothetical protein
VALPVCPRPRPRPRRRHRKKIALRSASGHSSFTRWRPAAPPLIPPLAKFRKRDETTKVSPKSVSCWLHRLISLLALRSRPLRRCEVRDKTSDLRR